MGLMDRRRLASLEARIGRRLPNDLLAVLNEREPIREGSVALVTPDRIWDVRASFAFDDGDGADQLDRVYELVGDVLPPNALPFAADWGDNFYCLMLSGPSEGRVVYWDHEREAFFEGLVRDPRHADAFYDPAEVKPLD
jgi:hypothetical protein